MSALRLLRFIGQKLPINIGNRFPFFYAAGNPARLPLLATVAYLLMLDTK
jgi:hypothetical protein